jgi:hypothetical protein
VAEALTRHLNRDSDGSKKAAHAQGDHRQAQQGGRGAERKKEVGGRLPLARCNGIDVPSLTSEVRRIDIDHTCRRNGLERAQMFGMGGCASVINSLCRSDAWLLPRAANQDGCVPPQPASFARHKPGHSGRASASPRSPRALGFLGAWRPDASPSRRRPRHVPVSKSGATTPLDTHQIPRHEMNLPSMCSRLACDRRVAFSNLDAEFVSHPRI